MPLAVAQWFEWTPHVGGDTPACASTPGSLFLLCLVFMVTGQLPSLTEAWCPGMRVQVTACYTSWSRWRLRGGAGGGESIAAPRRGGRGRCSSPKQCRSCKFSLEKEASQDTGGAVSSAWGGLWWMLGASSNPPLHKHQPPPLLRVKYPSEGRPTSATGWYRSIKTQAPVTNWGQP